MLDINFYKKQSIVYLIISIVVLAFAIIYEIFSHNIYSIYMLGAFLIPLLFGSLFSFLIYKKKIKDIPNRVSVNFYNASIATFTVYCIIRGVLEIYGTTNNLINIYIIIALILEVISVFTNKKEE